MEFTHDPRIRHLLADRLADGLGSVLLSRLTVGQISEHLRREISGDHPLARATLRNELSLLRRAIHRAQQHHLVAATWPCWPICPPGRLSASRAA
jgi:hypothetical protein